MLKLFFPLIFALWAANAIAAPLAINTVEKPIVTAPTPDSRQLEKELQRLDWNQFRSVLEAIPKLKADVDAFGPSGWQFVQANYRYYPWRRLIDKLDTEQRQHLSELIQAAKKPS